MPVFDLDSVPPPHLFALPPGRPFFDDLVRTLLKDFEGRLVALPDVRIFVPSRRSVRALRHAFARQAPGASLLLPRIQAIGDLSEDDLLIGGAELAVDQPPEAPPAIVKRLKLAEIYQRARHADGDPVSWQGALRAATLLMRTSNQLTEYGVDAAAFERLGSDPAIREGAGHWARIVSILGSVTEDWPRWLAAEGLIDERERRALLLRALSRQLAQDGSSSLVIAAGFLGTSPSSQEFLAALARLDHGAVVLPGLDRELSDEAWEQVDAPHPQSAYRELLSTVFGVDRRQVIDLPVTEDPAGQARRKLLSLALMPSRATGVWAQRFQDFAASDDARDAARGLSVAVAKTAEEEADFIALAMREVLETPARTAFLVTADRILARRVAARLAGWGIELDDSGGAPLAGSFRATFLRLIARVMADPSDPVALAGLIHHQLFGLGMAPAERRPLVQSLDRALRGRRPRAGWDGLQMSLADDWRPYRPHREPADFDRAERLVRTLRSVIEPAMSGAEGSVERLLAAHLSIAGTLASTDKESGAERLYRFEDGEVLETHLQALQSRPELLGPATIDEYPEIFDTFLQGVAFRPPGGQHPRLSVYGILEARLQDADLVIVGGLEEGVWPGDAAVDPFLSRRVRGLLGLPSPDADIGRVAHDFMDFATRPEVLLTRAERRGRAPARPSRLMVRLESFLEKLCPDRGYDAAPRLRAWCSRRYAHAGRVTPAARPAPTPPAELRPRKVSVSTISTWLRDPYAVYAEHVLGLRRLSRYAEPFSARDRGDIVHALLEEVVARRMDDPDTDLPACIDECREDVLDRFDMPADQRLLNFRFLERSIANFLGFEAIASAVSEPIAVEAAGALDLDLPSGKVAIRGRADRIDRFHEGGVHIIDYKVGSGASTISEGKNFSPQLLLLALMARTGGIDGLGRLSPERISFLRLTDKEPPDPFKPTKSAQRRSSGGPELQDDLAAFERQFREWLERQLEGGTPMWSQLRPFKEGSDGYYDELARRAEWSRGEAQDDAD